MLVHLNQYRRDDANETVRSDGDVDPDHESDEYFDTDELEADEGWERVTHRGETVLRRAMSYDDVAAVSVPQDDLEETDDDLPGHDLQIRRGGDTEIVTQAQLVEATDQNP
ncbi:hypothetical protein [Natrialbaceae archaeon AArc-T1-2]|uniref:hypothetical protein n=1 Tax=Natrialbaceae archaeon AArc-T1-2 TaxID=3053904 RepID=UPI00255A7971|nr:hypothetical protein [Natrialbaceae archaeon AArc-T1-2]WIV66532.1 hypothetical protein QQ977_12640 [Natrialbaceae archaeon AArc-T1-2]